MTNWLWRVHDRSMSKQDGAFLTIGELAAELGIQQHILRYWESRFPMLRPLQRAGNRRYYRPEDVALVRRIHHLLNDEGYTVRGAQQALAGGASGTTGKATAKVEASSQESLAPSSGPAKANISEEQREKLIARLGDIRGRLETLLG